MNIILKTEVIILQFIRRKEFKKIEFNGIKTLIGKMYVYQLWHNLHELKIIMSKHDIKTILIKSKKILEQNNNRKYKPSSPW